MSLIRVNNLTFGYEGSYENIFENVSFDIDTGWKLGFIGRNGRGKTTLLRLFMGDYDYGGKINASVSFDYFPFEAERDKGTIETVRSIIAPFDKWEDEMNQCLAKSTASSLKLYGDILNLYMENDGFIIDELIEREIRKLDLNVGVLDRPMGTLSNGERTKVMIAALFLKKHNFLLIDEPTNHLDMEGRDCVARYLNSKKGFILVSHDRHFLDGTVDHILSINKNNVEIQKGNFSSWQDDKDRQDNYEIAKNKKLKKEIVELEGAFKRTAGWSNMVEKSKIGGHAGDRGYIGHKSAKMMKRAKSIERRKKESMDEKKKLLKNIEDYDDLKIVPADYHKDTLISVEDLGMSYGARKVLNNISFTVNKGDRLALRGRNGSGKSTILKILMGENIDYRGKVNIGNNLIISYVPQDTSFLKGSFSDFILNEGIYETIFRTLLSKLDVNEEDFAKNLEDLSQGQKKKVLIARSLSKSAHIYIWDEPLNYIDVYSRIQIEDLIKEYAPTMIFVEHDYAFNKNVATKVVKL